MENNGTKVEFVIFFELLLSLRDVVDIVVDNVVVVVVIVVVATVYMINVKFTFSDFTVL